MRMTHVKASRLFLIDAIGAGLSAFLLGVVLPRFESHFGMPVYGLYLLATIPLFFAVYDTVCYFRINSRWSTYIKAIAFANLGYCMLSIAMLYLHQASMTYLGWTYFIGELALVLSLAVWQLRTARTLKNQHSEVRNG